MCIFNYGFRKAPFKIRSSKKRTLNGEFAGKVACMGRGNTWEATRTIHHHNPQINLFGKQMWEAQLLRGGQEGGDRRVYWGSAQRRPGCQSALGLSHTLEALHHPEQSHLVHTSHFCSITFPAHRVPSLSAIPPHCIPTLPGQHQASQPPQLRGLLQAPPPQSDIQSPRLTGADHPHRCWPQCAYPCTMNQTSTPSLVSPHKWADSSAPLFLASARLFQPTPPHPGQLNSPLANCLTPPNTHTHTHTHTPPVPPQLISKSNPNWGGGTC